MNGVRGESRENLRRTGMLLICSVIKLCLILKLWSLSSSRVFVIAFRDVVITFWRCLFIVGIHLACLAPLIAHLGLGRPPLPNYHLSRKRMVRSTNQLLLWYTRVDRYYLICVDYDCLRNNRFRWRQKRRRDELADLDWRLTFLLFISCVDEETSSDRWRSNIRRDEVGRVLSLFLFFFLFNLCRFGNNGWRGWRRLRFGELLKAFDVALF